MSYAPVSSNDEIMESSSVHPTAAVDDEPDVESLRPPVDEQGASNAESSTSVQDVEPRRPVEDQTGRRGRSGRNSRGRSVKIMEYSGDVPIVGTWDCCTKTGRIQHAECCGGVYCWIGPHWDMMACPYVLTLLPIILFSAIWAPRMEWFINIFTYILFMVALVSLIGATCTDPGVIPKGTGDQSSPPSPDAKWCRHCEVWQPPRAQHCNDCDVCVEEYDHHCPWMGKCVAKGNFRSFTTFVSIVGVIPVYLIMLLLLGPTVRNF